MRYTVTPGLYAVGNPTDESPVFVSANYKMSFDRLRSELEGIDAWIMVLDTKGINVWCAAGKGTFGTAEIINRIAATGLDRIVSHRRIIVPQLGAPGVSAHEVKKGSGFRVVYGPVRAADIPAFMASGMRATPEMRRVRFPLMDRAVLIPVELVLWAKIALMVAAGFLVLSGMHSQGYELSNLKTTGLLSVSLFSGAYIGGAVLGPLFLPWLPGRSFSAKGAWAGLALVVFIALALGPEVFGNRLSTASWALIIPTVASFMVMNFTGASTYTSLSGVKREMRVAMPLQIAGAVLGVGLWVGGLFIS
jgi:acetyl-CoA decarbonylase/synthase complex subunit gamma